MSLCSSVRCCAKVLSVVGPVACIHETAFSQVGGSVCGSTSCTCRIRSEEQRIILTISVYTVSGSVGGGTFVVRY